MVTLGPSTVPSELPHEPLIQRRLSARSQEDAHGRARDITKQMKLEGQLLVARSWVSSPRGGTLTLVFGRRSAHGEAWVMEARAERPEALTPDDDPIESDIGVALRA